MSLFEWYSSRLFQRKDPLVRPKDQAISKHKLMLKKWESKQQKEIVAALLKDVFDNCHVHQNPVKRG